LPNVLVTPRSATAESVIEGSLHPAIREEGTVGATRVIRERINENAGESEAGYCRRPCSAITTDVWHALKATDDVAL
jgi:hypothetical protein